MAHQHFYRVNWRKGAPYPSPFMVIETEHDSVDALVQALNAGFVVANELFFNRSDENQWYITARNRCAIRADDVHSVHEPGRRIKQALEWQQA